MHGRFWLYLAAVIILVAETTILYGSRARLEREAAALEATNWQITKTSLEDYLAGQTDARKMVSLAKRMSSQDPRLIELIIERAYLLNPNSRDIAVLLAAFRPEMKKRVIELDPLYQLGE